MSDDDTKNDGFWSAEDLALWAQVSESVDPLAGKFLEQKDAITQRPFKRPKRPEHSGLSQNRASFVAPNYTRLPHLRVGEVVGVDKSLAGRVKEGKTPIDARLDLHGKTQQEAFEHLQYFINTAYAMNKRTVLIITGKGAGVLRAQVPQWLNGAGMREYVLMFSYARPQHGGDGALYVLLRKNKTH